MTDMFMHTNTGTVQSREDWKADGVDVDTTPDMEEVAAAYTYELTEYGYDNLVTLLSACIWDVDHHLVTEYWKDAVESLYEGNGASIEVLWVNAYDKCTHNFTLTEDSDYIKIFSHWVSV